MAGTAAGRILIRTPRRTLRQSPVYRLEMIRQARNRGLRVLHLVCLPAILGITGLAVVGVLVGTFPQQVQYGFADSVPGVLAILFILMFLIQLAGGAFVNILTVAQAAPAISGELELRSWGLLRTTTLLLREIVLAKYIAVLTYLRGSLIGLVILRISSTITGLLLVGYFVLRELIYYMWPGDLKEWVAHRQWLPLTVAVLVVAAWYVVQPVVQYMLNAALGMLASAMTRSRGQAITAGLAARLVGWIVSILTNTIAIYTLGYLLLGNWADPAYAPIPAFRSLPQPSEEQVTLVVCATIVLYVLAVLATQVGTIVVLLALAQQRARRLGV